MDCSYTGDTTVYLGFNPTLEFSTRLWQVNRVLNKVKKWMDIFKLFDAQHQQNADFRLR